jgi:hypothetical protein
VLLLLVGWRWQSWLLILLTLLLSSLFACGCGVVVGGGGGGGSNCFIVAFYGRELFQSPVFL